MKRRKDEREETEGERKITFCGVRESEREKERERENGREGDRASREKERGRELVGRKRMEESEGGR